MNNPESYIEHPLNISKSKEAHLFPRARRFHTEKNTTTSAFYNLPSTISQRTTTLGYGNKINIAMKTISPPPDAYKPTSEFQRKQYSNIPSIGQSRQKVTFGSFLLQAMKKSKDCPSPNKYNIPNYRSTIGGFMGERIKTDLQLKQKKTLPGPGTYKLDSIQIKNKGNYALSTFKNATSPRYFYSKDRGSEALKSKRNTCASISYDIQQKQIGKYSVSTFANLVSHSFSKSKRQGLQDKSKIHIPGSKYRRFSDFAGLQQ